MTEQNRHRIPCPYCGVTVRIRTSKSVTPLFREAALECLSAECGWRGKASIEITHTCAPSKNRQKAAKRGRAL